MAQLKAGSTAGGAAILTTAANSWPAASMSFSTGPGLSEGYIKKAATTDNFEVVETASTSVTSQVQGSVKSFISGGAGSTLGSNTAVIDTFPFSAPFSTATSAGNLSQSRGRAASHSSSTNGYTSGGIGTPTTPPYPAPSIYQSTIDSFPFASPFTTASSVGSLWSARYNTTGHSSTTDGYTVSGSSATPPSAVIDKYPFSAPFATASAVGNVPTAQDNGGAFSSFVHGFVSGGFVFPVTQTSSVERFPFTASPISSTFVGDLTSAKGAHAGVSSSEYGYNVGGWDSGGATLYTTIDRFPFSAPFVVTTSAGTMFAGPPFPSGRVAAAGTNGVTKGYASGGFTQTGQPNTSAISTFPFSTTPFGSIADVANLSSARSYAAGQQY